ncbi:MAG: GHKL domain-containing protein [Deltaproteobacteria bacterium]|nr:GHKL domain-containing protein [Deltaproteobacteria bacterium]
MSETFSDPKIDLVRVPFLEGLSRVCMLLALGHFLCIPPLYFMAVQSHGHPLLRNYITAITISGILLTVIALFSRIQRFRSTLSYLSFSLLFVQVTYFLFHIKSFFHPVVMFYPLLCILAPPVLGKRGSYFIVIASQVIMLLFYSLENQRAALWQLVLMVIGLTFAGYLSNIVWGGMLDRESKLRKTLNELKKKSDEMETWIQQLGRASSLISAGQLSTALPTPPPFRVFAELTRSLEQMQEKLRAYFANLLLKDRIGSIGLLASGIAHELNTPLTTLQFLLDREKRIPVDLKDEILLEVERMSGITKGLLQFASPREAQLMDLNALVLETEPLLHRAKKDRVELELDLEKSALPITVVPNQIQQVLLNLFMNAKDAIENTSKPVITIRTRRKSDFAFELIVADNGCGMDSQTLSRVLEPFYTTKAPGRGTGLGLFIVHQVCEAHKATLEIESSLQKGTTVRLSFTPAEATPLQKAA